MSDPISSKDLIASLTSAPPAENPKENIPEDFPERLYCPQCRRPYPVQNCRSQSNTLLTEIKISCPRCRRRLRRMKMKDWYDHYVLGLPPVESIPD